jgi:hypothetical protein
MTTHKTMPVAGYSDQTDENIELVNVNKRLEEKVLRQLDMLSGFSDTDKRWLDGRPHPHRTGLHGREPCDHETRTSSKETSVMEVEDIARIAHEVNRAYCEAVADPSQLPWDEAPQWQKDSAVKGVRAALDNPSMTPEGSHKGWMAHKKADGWVYGPRKDPEKKQHPCMVPYDQLPLQQRVKDHLFLAVVNSSKNLKR